MYNDEDEDNPELDRNRLTIILIVLGVVGSLMLLSWSGVGLPPRS